MNDVPKQLRIPKWGVSSAGRAPALQAGGHRFDPGTLHQEDGTEAKPSEAGLIRRGETKTQWSFEIEDFKTENVDLVSTGYGPIAQLARAHD